MMTENKFTKNFRATIVTNTRVFSTKPQDALHPNLALFPTSKVSIEQAKTELWCLVITTKSGFDQEHTQFFYFADEPQALAFMEEYPIGEELDSNLEGFPLNFRDLFADGPTDQLRLFSADDSLMFLCYEVLNGAGLCKKGSECAPIVENWHGSEKLDWLKETFGENWSAVADLEYCLNHFPGSSMVVVACKALYNYFVTYDDYSAGYYYRELELMNGGAEQLATSSVKAREKAGKGGSQASQAAKAKRLQQFMAEIEALGDLFPRMSERAILDQAFENAVKANPASWKQGQGQQEQYETELRSDPAYRTRYFQIFARTA